MKFHPPVQRIEHETVNSLHIPTLLGELDCQETFGRVESFFLGFQAIHFVQQLLLCVEKFAEIQFAEIHFDFCPPLILGWGHLLLLCVELFAEIQFAEIHFAEIHFDFCPPLILEWGHLFSLCVELFAEIQFVEIHFDFYPPLILEWGHLLLLCVELFAEIQFVDFCLLFGPGLGYSLLLFGQSFAGSHRALAKSSVGEPLRGLLGNALRRPPLQESPFWLWCAAEWQGLGSDQRNLWKLCPISCLNWMCGLSGGPDQQKRSR